MLIKFVRPFRSSRRLRHSPPAQHRPGRTVRTGAECDRRKLDRSSKDVCRLNHFYYLKMYICIYLRAYFSAQVLLMKIFVYFANQHIQWRFVTVWKSLIWSLANLTYWVNVFADKRFECIRQNHSRKLQRRMPLRFSKIVLLFAASLSIWSKCRWQYCKVQWKDLWFISILDIESRKHINERSIESTIRKIHIMKTIKWKETCFHSIQILNSDSNDYEHPNAIDWDIFQRHFIW